MRTALISLCLGAAALAVADPPVYEGGRLATPPKIDGVVEDAEWTGAIRTAETFDSDTNAPSPLPTEFRLGYDAKYVYLAARLTDDRPSEIRDAEWRTNVSFPGDDSVGFSLDTRGALNDFDRFFVNPRGATDIRLAGGRAAKREWTGEFTARSRRTPTGWETEARIPWSLLAYPSGGVRDLRFNLTRRSPRLGRTFVLRFTGNGLVNDVPLWRGVELPPPFVDRSIKLLPYAYGGADRQTGLVFNSGLDLKTQLNQNVQVVGAVNPDFRNVENAVLNLDFSRFERLADETRPFFLEGREFLGTRIFASQRIPGFDVGLNSYGRLDAKTTFGVLNALDLEAMRPNGERAGRNNFVMNVGRQFDPQTSANVAVTNLSWGPVQNTAYNARVSRNFGPYELFLVQRGTQDAQAGRGVDQYASLSYGLNGFYLYGGYQRTDPDYVARLAFVPETNRRGYEFGGGYERPSNRGPILNSGGFFNHENNRRVTGEFYRRNFNGGLYATFRNQINVFAGIDRSDFLGSRDRTDTISVNFPQDNVFRNAGIGYTHGRIAGESYTSYNFNGTYRWFNRLQVGVSQQVLVFGEYLDQTVGTLAYDLDSYRTISGRLVKQGPNVNFYLSFRKAGNKGAEYFLILGDPNSPTFRTSLILKAVIPFQIG